MALDVTLDLPFSTFDTELKKLLSNKDKLVAQGGKGTNRNQYQIEIQKLKDKMKAYKKSGKAKKGEILSFGKLLKDVKKQEREGTFDRGAEGKKLKKLRAQMAEKKTKEDRLYKAGIHKGSLAESNIKLEEKRKEARGKR
jgi:hypothetical protein